MNPDLPKGAQDWLLERAKEGGFVSDGPVRPPAAGMWGKHPFSGNVAHWWTATFSAPEGQLLQSKCGAKAGTTAQIPLLGAGSWPHCSRCDGVLLRNMRNRR